MIAQFPALRNGSPHKGVRSGRAGWGKWKKITTGGKKKCSTVLIRRKQVLTTMQHTRTSTDVGVPSASDGKYERPPQCAGCQIANDRSIQISHERGSGTVKRRERRRKGKDQKYSVPHRRTCEILISQTGDKFSGNVYCTLEVAAMRSTTRFEYPNSLSYHAMS